MSDAPLQHVIINNLSYRHNQLFFSSIPFKKPSQSRQSSSAIDTRPQPACVVRSPHASSAARMRRPQPACVVRSPHASSAARMRRQQPVCVVTSPYSSSPDDKRYQPLIIFQIHKTERENIHLWVETFRFVSVPLLWTGSFISLK